MPFHARASRQGPPFLPLAFRLGASLGLAALHLALPPEGPLPGEWVYLGFLAAVFIEGVFEAFRNLDRFGDPFAVPPKNWIRWNLLLDISVVLLVVAFQGVNQERLFTFYVLPVLASAFYLGTVDILGVALFTAAAHIVMVLSFDAGWLPSFGHTVQDLGRDPADTALILALATLQIFAAALVVVLLRRNIERLDASLVASEAAVDELEALHRRVVDSLFSGLVTLDARGRITSANPAAAQILHGPVAIGEPMAALFPGAEALEEAVRGTRRFELPMTAPGGEPRILGGQVAPLKDPEGSAAAQGHLLIFQDLTEFKAMEERTRVAERLAALGHLSAGLAHELRNPLASIMGCVQLLQDERQTAELQKRLVSILARESGRVDAIVKDFLDFARPGEPKRERRFLPSVAEDLQASWETDPRTDGLALVIGPAPPVWIETDPVGFHRTLTNLLSNARKAVAGMRRPEVGLDFRLEGGRLRILVHDNGRGMDAERMRTLFVPFASGFEEGTGLGLSLVYQFVQAMGWEIKVESAPGKGTKIRLFLPVLPEAGAASQGR
ncbi:MAG TPA: ATP-binding protein [Holophagaceae bacterium]|jgi:two-component system sensor histidine kinase PilS (NtrC family)|nr:ATP-binding protein [Holophagaceae bacterium]